MWPYHTRKLVVLNVYNMLFGEAKWELLLPILPPVQAFLSDKKAEIFVRDIC